LSLRKAVECIKKSESFLITAHTNLEGDALGAELGFLNLVKKLGKQGVVVNEDDVPYGYDFLPGKNGIKKLNRKTIGTKFDCFVVVDCSDLNRTGEVYKINRDKPVLNIDHHISNALFADVNWVDPHASSASEMIYRLFKKMRVALDKESAVALYTGIVADTGYFHYSNTSSFTHKAISELLKFNLNIPLIFKNLYENIPFQDMKLLAKILPTIRREEKGIIAWFQIKRKMLKHGKISIDLSEHLLSFARAIKDVEVVVLFKENMGVRSEIRINLRSQGKVDVNKVAQYFGGGGHKAAAGATVKGKIEQVRKKVLAKIKESLKNN